MKPEAEHNLANEAEAGSADRERLARRIARLESLRRWMLVLAPILMLGGYVMDRLPVLYATALPLSIALLVTYRIKHLEESVEK